MADVGGGRGAATSGGFRRLRCACCWCQLGCAEPVASRVRRRRLKLPRDDAVRHFPCASFPCSLSPRVGVRAGGAPLRCRAHVRVGLPQKIVTGWPSRIGLPVPLLKRARGVPEALFRADPESQTTSAPQTIEQKSDGSSAPTSCVGVKRQAPHPQTSASPPSTRPSLSPCSAGHQKIKIRVEADSQPAPLCGEPDADSSGGVSDSESSSAPPSAKIRSPASSPSPPAVVGPPAAVEAAPRRSPAPLSLGLLDYSTAFLESNCSSEDRIVVMYEPPKRFPSSSSTRHHRRG